MALIVFIQFTASWIFITTKQDLCQLKILIKFQTKLSRYHNPIESQINFSKFRKVEQKNFFFKFTQKNQSRKELKINFETF